MTIGTGVDSWRKCLFMWEQVGGGVHFAAGLRTRIGEETWKATRVFTNY